MIVGCNELTFYIIIYLLQYCVDVFFYFYSIMFLNLQQCADFGGACLSRLRIFSWIFYLEFSGLLCLCFAVLCACVLH